jgi:hypothetical protein
MSRASECLDTLTQFFDLKSCEYIALKTPVVCKTKIVRDVMSFRNVPLVIRKTHHV